MMRRDLNTRSVSIYDAGDQLLGHTLLVTTENTEADQQAKEQQHTWWSSRRCELNKPTRTNIDGTPLFDIYALFSKKKKIVGTRSV